MLELIQSKTMRSAEYSSLHLCMSVLAWLCASVLLCDGLVMCPECTGDRGWIDGWGYWHEFPNRCP